MRIAESRCQQDLQWSTNFLSLPIVVTNMLSSHSLQNVMCDHSSCECSRRLQADLAPLNEELLQLVQRLQPSPEERSQQASAFDAVRQLLQACAVLWCDPMCEADTTPWHTTICAFHGHIVVEDG